MTQHLMMSAKKKWRKLDGQNRLPEIILGDEFRDGIKQEIKVAGSTRHKLSRISPRIVVTTSARHVLTTDGKSSACRSALAASAAWRATAPLPARYRLRPPVRPEPRTGLDRIVVVPQHLPDSRPPFEFCDQPSDGGGLRRSEVLLEWIVC